MLTPIEVTLTARHCMHMREVDASGWLAKRDEDAIIDTAHELMNKGYGAGQGMVRGFRVTSYLRDVQVEVLYAVTPAGNVFCCGPHKVRDTFEAAGDAWSPIPDLPETAEFIGNYHRPRNM